MNGARPAVFLDRDGVINENRDEYVLSWDQFSFIDGSIAAIKRLTEAGWPVVVVTNQSAIGRGLVRRRTVDDIHVRMCTTISAAGGNITRVMLCPHRPDAGCRCRKPRPGMLRAAARDLGIDLSSSILIGDSATDIAAAHAAGARAILVQTGRGRRATEELDSDVRTATMIVRDLVEAVDHILDASSASAAEAVPGGETRRYFESVAEALVRIDGRAVDRLVEAIRRARDRGGTVYTLGNGGSAATASHLALDIAKNTRRPDRRAIRAFALTDNAGLVTAWANDSHYDEVFSAQLEAVARPEDLVIAVSGSGNSNNVLRAIAVANGHGADTFGITGFAGGQLAQVARDCVIVPSDNMQVVEDGHLAITHAVMCALRDQG
ncbi:MAG: D-glycero-beta-D-manno-heptose 1,7-bisphosphate 7-phosphatase [Chloroflexota bacterium]|nr:MAG: D-glycero-beta-D-manno-heptose 1,7-bisphosphate 7-phosphatase [Chloroflexota bacterium]